MVAFLHPFRLVNAPASPPWQLTVEDVNRRNWDYVALHEIVGGADVGLPPPYHMVFARDGGMALPPIPQLRNDQEAVEFFNRCFAAMLLGGVYCEAIGLDGLDFGSIIDWKYIRVHTGAPAAANRFHQLIRLRRASSFEAIALCDPRSAQAGDLRTAMSAGRSILEALSELSGEFLLKGVSGIARRDWGTALANLWIVVEQITSNLWDRRMVGPAQGPDPIPGRSINSPIQEPGPSQCVTNCYIRSACCPVIRLPSSLRHERRATRLPTAGRTLLPTLHNQPTPPPPSCFRSLSQISRSPY
jgi:hypothetical protein